MIKMADLIKKQNDMIRKSTGMYIVKKEQLSEAISFSKEEMAKLHNDGSLEKDGNTYVYQEGGPGSGPHGNGDDEENPFDREPSDDEMADIEKEFEGVNEAKKIDSKTWKKMKYQIEDQIDDLVKIGEDYGVFQSAQYTAKTLKKIQKMWKSL